MNITIFHRYKEARRGQIQTSHGTIETPFFMPVATSATVKGLSSDQMLPLNAQILLSNTYHLHLRPGSEIIRDAGGLHTFMNWNGPILTDSGGFQVFSLAKVRKITEEGVTFNSHIDGKEIFLSPEESMRIQVNLGADIIMAFDDCKPPDSRAEVEKSIAITTEWEKRSKLFFIKNSPPAKGEMSRSDRGGLVGENQHSQSLFGIVQGATFPDLRAKHARELVSIGFDGYAIGGLSVGESETDMYAMTEAVVPHLPQDQPRYLMGVGTPVNLIESVMRGIDMFDCVLPTRNARHGNLFTSQGTINIQLEKYKADFTPIDPNCSCTTCVGYTKAYLRHLLSSGEITGMSLLVYHNLHYYLNLMAEIRKAIEEERLENLRDALKLVYH